MDIRQQIEDYMNEWLKTEDVITLQAWNEVKDAVYDSVSSTNEEFTDDISREEEVEIQQILDDMVLNASIGSDIPLSYLVTGSEQLKRIETKLKSEHENDTN